jgi:sugar lactone lactonase YvrE
MIRGGFASREHLTGGRMRPQLCAFLLTPCVMIGAAVSTAQPGATASLQLQQLREALHASHQRNDWQANLASANQQKTLLNGAPHALLEIARAQVHLGNLDAALQEIRQFAAMGQAAELSAVSPDFAPLVASPAFGEIRAAMVANGQPVAMAATAVVLPDAMLLAEDLDYDAQTRRFYVTSVRQKKIIVTDASGGGRDFAAAPDSWPLVAIKVDARRGRVWATEVAMQDLNFSAQADWGRSALLCYDLHTGKLLRRVEGPPHSGLGDMTLARDGAVVVSDGDGGGVYRLGAADSSLQRLDGGDFISPQTPALHPDGKHIFVPDYVRGIGVLDVATRQVSWLATQGRFALNGIDGLYFDHGRLLAVQNGTSPERVVAFTLDPTLRRVLRATVIERATPSLGDPTHGVVSGGRFYYIANSGWDVIDEHGALKAGATASAARIMQVRLAAL